MGNGSSTPAATEAAAASTTVLTPKGQTRRIVKAVKPTTQTEAAVTPLLQVDKEEKDDSSADVIPKPKTTVQPKTKAKREQKLQQHRLTPKAAAATTTKETTTPTPNPMSRFLSAFSVEPKHPEHKRRATEGIADSESPKQPLEKRLRAQDDADVGDAAEHDNAAAAVPPLSRTMIWLSSAALVVAVAAAVWWRGKKR